MTAMSAMAPSPENISPIKLNRIVSNNLNLIIFFKYCRSNKQGIIADEPNFALLNIQCIIDMILCKNYWLAIY